MAALRQEKKRGKIVVKCHLLALGQFEFQFNIIVFDESHNLRNPADSFSRLAVLYPAAYKILCTATPMLNRLEDI